jgi:hypothetical protein
VLHDGLHGRVLPASTSDGHRRDLERELITFSQAFVEWLRTALVKPPTVLVVEALLADVLEGGGDFLEHLSLVLQTRLCIYFVGLSGEWLNQQWQDCVGSTPSDCVPIEAPSDVAATNVFVVSHLPASLRRDLRSKERESSVAVQTMGRLPWFSFLFSLFEFVVSCDRGGRISKDLQSTIGSSGLSSL